MSVRTLFATTIERAKRPDGSLDQDRLLTLVKAAHAETTEHLRAEADRLKIVLDNIAHGVCFFDGTHHLIASNTRFAEIYDLRPEHVRPGISLGEIVALRDRAGSMPRMDPLEYLSMRTRVTTLNGADESVAELCNGKVVLVWHKPIAGGGWVSTHEDITERHRAERQAILQRTYDGVTGLPNDVLLSTLLQTALAGCSAVAPCALLAIDLDGLRHVNGALGRSAGNDLIRKVSDRMRERIPEGSTLARPGGGEFSVIQTGADQPNGARRLAVALLQALAEPFEMNGQSVVVGATIGIAIASDPPPDAETFVRNATTALQRAKAESVGAFRVFTPEMDAAARARRALEHDLREAVGAMAFELHYQPQVTLRTRRVTGFEALLRWRHPARGNVPPGDFIPLAEELGLITAIGRWVLREACREATRWPDDISVAVNVSPLQFNDDDLPTLVGEVLRDTGLPPTRLELEITETIMMERHADTLAALHELRASGIRVAIDDFGIGYSSLSYLPSFPFDKIKIDRSFVSGNGRPRDRHAIVHAIIGLCDSLGMTCTAEGVETEDQLATLVAEHCPQAQGYLFSKPLPAREVDAVLARLNADVAAAPDEVGESGRKSAGVEMERSA